MRTIVAPLNAQVHAELEALDPRRREIARRYIRRLALEPTLGSRVLEGALAQYGARRVYFDAHDTPDDLFDNRAAPRRRGDQHLGDGPKWRIVYWPREAPRANVRLVVILAIGLGHTERGQPNAYERAAARVRNLGRRTP